MWYQLPLLRIPTILQLSEHELLGISTPANPCQFSTEVHLQTVCLSLPWSDVGLKTHYDLLTTSRINNNNQQQLKQKHTCDDLNT